MDSLLDRNNRNCLFVCYHFPSLFSRSFSLKVKEKGKEKRKRKEISQLFFSRISLSFVNKFDHPLVSLEGHNQVVIFIKQACPK